jgi:DNA-binding CsgD family transcriptional regulator
MSEYLSKEEIKQWRSSLEKITLEEFAARLGKKIEPAKPTNDLIDIVLKGKPVVSTEPEYKRGHAERLSSIAERAYEREQQIAPTPFSIHRIVEDTEVKKEKSIKPKEVKTSAKIKSSTVKKAVKTADKSEKIEKPVKKAVSKTTKKSSVKSSKPVDLREEVRIVFKKALTDREQKVFDHFAQNKGKIVYAKDLAALLELPRDYVYKYIKNLRAKIEGDKLENADKGGFILHI